MGLFNWLKKGGQQDVSADAGVAPVAAPSFDELMAAARANQPGAMDALWKFVFGLPQWHFVVKETPDLTSGSVPPLFCVLVDQRPLLCAFTSEKRATEFGVKRQFSSGFAVVSVAMPKAIATALANQQQGVWGVVFDENVGGGCFAPMSNLVGLYAVSTGLGLMEAAERCGVDPAKVMYDRLSATGSQEHLQEYVAWACDRPAWWMLADPNDAGRPRVWEGAMDGKKVCAIFTDAARARDFAGMMKNVDASGAPMLVQCSPIDAAALIEQCILSIGLESVVLNTHVPLPANTLGSMVRVLGKRS